MNKKGLAFIAIGDTLLVAAVLIVVFLRKSQGGGAVILAVLCGFGALAFFAKGIREIRTSRKPPQEPPWKPIEP